MPTTIASTRAQGFRAADASISRAAGGTPAPRHMVVTPAAREGEVSTTRVARSGGYQQTLRNLHPSGWDAFLLAHSGLPGPRANLELLQAAADEADETTFRRWLAIDAARTPPNTPDECLPACGAVGLGRLAASGRRDVLVELRRHASDLRWRVREGVAI